MEIPWICASQDFSFLMTVYLGRKAQDMQLYKWLEVSVVAQKCEVEFETFTWDFENLDSMVGLREKKSLDFSHWQIWRFQSIILRWITPIIKTATILLLIDDDELMSCMPLWEIVMWMLSLWLLKYTCTANYWTCNLWSQKRMIEFICKKRVYIQMLDQLPKFQDCLKSHLR